MRRRKDRMMMKLNIYFETNDASRIRWAHAVNSKKYLEDCLGPDGRYHMLEADILLEPISNQPIMAHPPATHSDISAEEWIDRVARSRKHIGMKLDFKSIGAVEPVVSHLQRLHESGVLDGDMPVLLNADVLPGPNRPPSIPVPADEFIELCQRFCPWAVLSLGWTTAIRYPLWEVVKRHAYALVGWSHMITVSGANEGYQDWMVDEMLQVLRTHNVTQEVTFPVRSSLVCLSRPQVDRLLSQSADYSLTVWTSLYDNVDVARLRFPMENRGRVYFDLSDDLIQAIDSAT